uniref:N-acetyltransferase domain-containing protein n=1 Tax=Bionectria ochroleuca TaxID=29856 RepID=A0A8H7KER9_BIOOC
MPSDAEPGKLEDVPRLVEIWEACFNSEMLHALFPPNEIGRTYLTRAWNWYMEENSPPKVFVIRDDDGIVQSGIVIYAQTGEPIKWQDRWAPPIKGMNEEIFQAFCESLDSQHHAIMGNQPHSFVETLMTHPSAQRQGFGSKLLDRAARVNPELPTYLDSAADATGLYQRVGFVRQPEELQKNPDAIPMLRPAVGK